MSVYKVDICGVTTSKLPVLKDEEKEELFEKIKKGDKVGEIIVKNNGKVVSRMNLTVKNDVKKANLFELYIKYLKDIASGNMTL